MRRLVPSIPVVLTVLACKAGDDGDFDFDGQTAATLAMTVSTTATGTDTAATDTTGETGGPGTTTGVDPATGTDSTGADDTTTDVLPTEPCTAIDVLVVIDNSDAMADEQARIGVALGPFIEAINQQVPGVLGSIHVAIVTTDAPEFVTSNPSMTCTPYASAANWMAYGPTLSTEMTCASAVGTMGDPDERPMQMAIEALSPELLGINGFNEGFLREQGPLVLVIVTDEEDDFEPVTEWGSVGDPGDWVEALAATQDGFVQNVIPLVLVGIPQPNACATNPWNGVDGAEVATRITEFAESFPHHAVGDACAVEYTSFLNGAVPEIAAACAAWVPE